MARLKQVNRPKFAGKSLPGQALKAPSKDAKKTSSIYDSVKKPRRHHANAGRATMRLAVIAPTDTRSLDNNANKGLRLTKARELGIFQSMLPFSRRVRQAIIERGENMRVTRDFLSELALHVEATSREILAVAGIAGRHSGRYTLTRSDIAAALITKYPKEANSFDSDANFPYVSGLNGAALKVYDKMARDRERRAIAKIKEKKKKEKQKELEKAPPVTPADSDISSD